MESSLFVIDSSPAIRRLVEKAAEHGGYQVKAFSDGPTALEEASRLKPQIIIADYHLEGLTFTTFCEKLNELDLIPDTLLVLLVNSSDRCDETSMRSRGVRGFLKKPLQSGQIVEMIQELKNNHSPGNTKKATRANKSWPPQTQMTNLEEPFAMDSDDQEEEMLDLLPELPEAVAAPQPPPPESKSAATASAAAAGSVAHKKPEVADPVKPKPAPQPQPVTTASPPPAPSASPIPGNGLTPQLETAMRGFLAQLVQALDSRSDSQQGSLTEIIMQQMGSHIQGLVQAEVSSQLAAAKPGEQATKAAQEAVQQMLPHMVPEHLTAMESSIQQSLRETTGRVVEELTERLVKDMTAAAVQKHLPEMIAQHLGSVENWVKEAAKEAASTHARESADQAVREIASETIRQLVPTVVPDLAESQIKKEIERLTTPT